MAYEKGSRPEVDSREEARFAEEKSLRICGKENNEIDYKDVAKLKKYSF